MEAPQDKVRASADTAGDLVGKTRADAIETMKNQLAKMDQNIDELVCQLDGLRDNPKKEASDAIDKLREARDAASSEVDELANVGEEAWQDVKSAFDDAWDEVESAYGDAKSKRSE